MGDSTRKPGSPARPWSVLVAVTMAYVAGPSETLAQAVGDRIRAASEGSTRPYDFPRIDEAKMLRGAALLAELRSGGLVLFMRHTQTGTVTPQCGPSNLTPAGERDARFVGESLRALKVPVNRVLTSPVCRVADTAKLLSLGEPEATADLSNVPASPETDLEQARTRRIATTPDRGGNVVLVSHMQGGKSQNHWIYLDFGEIIAYRPNGKGSSEPLARIRADDWYDLMALDKTR